MSACDCPETTLSSARAIEEAARLAAVMRRHCVRSGGNSINWNSACFDLVSMSRVVRPMGFCLYDGMCGPALFLSAFEHVSAGAGLRDLLAIIADRLMSELGPGAVRAFGLGAGTGLPSAIYSLARMSAFLGEASFLDKAERLARLLTREAIFQDSVYDLIGGTGGCILALLATYRMRPEADFLLDLAMACGEHLLANRVPGPTGLRSWQTTSGRLHSGFAHGGAGIAYSLAALFAVCGKQEFRDAALEACCFENTLWDESTHNWWDYPEESGRRAAQFRWCHGAPGIGLGRLGMLDPQCEFLLADGLRAATQAAIARPAEIDHACCGNAGRVELMLVAGQHDEFYRSRASQLGEFMVRQARTRGNYNLGFGWEHNNFAFHQGIAGLGYQWLRLADSTRVPSVLLWQ